MEDKGKQQVSRRTYRGAEVYGPARIKSMRMEYLENVNPVRVVNVPNMSHYESGCKVHRGCFGHICRTPTGVYLPPQSMSMRNGPIATEYFKASVLAFKGDKTGYIDLLKKTNYTKEGTMRSIMSTPVAGSYRLIATPQWECGRKVVLTSENLASKMRVCVAEAGDDGIRNMSYTERSLAEGDYGITGRPPSLSIYNTQGMRTGFWAADCAGIHPETFARFHGDFDGDELHYTPVYDSESVRECVEWEVPKYEPFEKGRDMLYEFVHRQPRPSNDDNHMAKFIEYSTVSSKSLVESDPQILLGKVSRCKPEHVTGMHRRFNTSSTEEDDVMQSIRGMDDVCRQQLSQGSIGHMTRNAKVAAMCFLRPKSGGLYVSAKGGLRLLSDDGICDSGCPAVRATMAVCAVAQQAALDSHRVGEKDNESHDFVSDMFLGRGIEDEPGSCNPTLVIFSATSSQHTLKSLRCKWRYTLQEYVIVLCLPSAVEEKHARLIKGAYNPRVLAMCQKVGINVVELCSLALKTVCNYYSVQVSSLELNDLAYVFSYQVEKSFHPITSRDGIVKRDISGLEKLLATDFTKVPSIVGEEMYPNTSTSAMFMGNFTRLATREDK